MVKKVVEIIYIKAGGGHVATSMAIGNYLKKVEPNVVVKYTDIRNVLDNIDPIEKYLRFKVEDFYNMLISHNFGYGSEFMLRLSQKIIQFYYEEIVETLTSYHINNRPDIVISTIPNFNKAINESLYRSNGIHISRKQPLIVVVCDFADLPPHFWVEDIDAFYICPTQKVFEQVCHEAPNYQYIVPTNGVVLREEFYNHEYIYTQNKSAIGLVSFGGYGSNSMLRLAKAVQSKWFGFDQIGIDFIYLAGYNTSLATKLAKLVRTTDKVCSYTSNIIPLLEKSDFFVGKPGPGSISEALAIGLPIVIEKNRGTLIQERYNADWVEEHEVGVVTKDISTLNAIMKIVTYNKYTMNIQTNIPKNDALFKVTDLVRRFL
jgi:UDP-N-acetylglucosamine:LPS N-acetylglucosamine transferase